MTPMERERFVVLRVDCRPHLLWFDMKGAERMPSDAVVKVESGEQQVLGTRLVGSLIASDPLHSGNSAFMVAGSARALRSLSNIAYLPNTWSGARCVGRTFCGPPAW